jgi:hypothetical protein
MRYIECPEEYTGNETSLFLAGGISGCPDWQKELKQKLINTSLILINPRRADFDITNPLMEQQQIEWEHRHLERAKIISFWFPRETLCPITLFELGKYARDASKILFIGRDEEYKRKRDIDIQINLIRPEIQIVNTLEDLSKQIQKYIS